LTKTYLIITADHGEGFGEHNLSGHGNSLYSELLNIPLIIYPPGGRTIEPAVINKPASNIDIFPTILEFAKIQHKPLSSGSTLTRFFSRNYRSEKNIFYSESPNIEKIFLVAYQDNTFKYIYNPETDSYEIYNAIKDPRELKNLWPAKTIPAEIRNSIANHQKENDIARASFKI
jgi:arylsulfatase A-like enzyme